MDALAGRMRAFLHELSNLVDASTRSLTLARRGLGSASLLPTARAAPSGGGLPPPDVLRHVDVAATALAHIADLIRSIDRPLAGAIRLTGHDRFDEPRPLVEAVRHAVAVLRPLAEERGAKLFVEIGPGVSSAPPAPIYPVIANALRNALDAAAPPGARAVPSFRVRVRIEMAATADAGLQVRIEVADDGPGPPAGQEHRVFDLGFSTMTGSSGIGLALAREIVSGLGGTIELRARRPDAPPGAPRGAVLDARYPVRPDTPGKVDQDRAC